MTWRDSPKVAQQIKTQKHSRNTLWGTPRQEPKNTQKTLRGTLSGRGPEHSCKFRQAQSTRTAKFDPRTLLTKMLTEMHTGVYTKMSTAMPTKVEALSVENALEGPHENSHESAHGKFPVFTGNFPRIFLIFVPDFAPNFAPNFPRIFRGFFVLHFVRNGVQKKFTRNPRHFSMQNSQANTKKIFTQFLWRAGKGGNVHESVLGQYSHVLFSHVLFLGQ